MAPTTLIGQKSSTCVDGRDADYHGRPIRMSEMLAQLDGVCYVERVTIDTPKHINDAKNAIKKAFVNQQEKKGFSMVEIISPCPIGWGYNPVDAYAHIKEEVLPFYSLGVFKDR